MVEILDFIMANGMAFVSALLATKVLASLIVNLTPTPVDDNVVGKFYTFLEWLAGIWTQKAKEFPGESLPPKTENDT